MFCAYHPSNAASVSCVSCNRPLCAACDHRIKAQPVCEDCIVRGIDALRRPAPQMIAPVVAPKNAPSPRKATLFALVPGLGAVYNRQNLKALTHFVGTVGLFELSGITDSGFFAFGGIVFFLYSMIDANRTARAIAAGEDPAEDERHLKWLFARYKPLWGLLLVAVALIATLSSLPALPFGLTQGRLWAVVLFLTGGYLIYSYFKSLGKEDDDASFATRPPRSVVSAMLPPSDIGHATSAYGETRSTSHLADR
jgi:hypothetical protein